MSPLSHTALLQLAVDMANSVTASDRFERLLNTVRSHIQCDAVVLLRLQGEVLKPLAQKGLHREILGRRFTLQEHPRLATIHASTVPVRFSSDCDLPDPYDGMLPEHDGDLPIHACMGLPLLADDQIIGVLTMDSMLPGAFDDIPGRSLELIAAMSAASLKTAMLLERLEHHSQHVESVVAELTQEALNKDGGELIGDSNAMQKLQREITLVAPSDYAILIEGETGVGKELIARTLHSRSNRSQGPLVYVNCAAIPENLVESELFGHVKGAFTGADRNRAGKFSLADGGTLFLDEIGELPLAAQSKLLRALQSHEIQPVGQDKVDKVDVRVLAATNRVLEKEVAGQRFRADLYHRLNVYPIKVPPLRDRQGDAALLAGYFCEATRRKLGMRQLLLRDDAVQVLDAYDWPGNVRELEHVISRAALIARAASVGSIVQVHAEHLGLLMSQMSGTADVSEEVSSEQGKHEADSAFASGVERSSSDNSGPVFVPGASEGLKTATEEFQKQLILRQLQHNDGNWAAAARDLQTDRANLVRLAKRLDIEVVREIIVR